MIPREISGPQERFERTGGQALRDLRPISTRLSAALMGEFSGAALCVALGAMLLEPASVDVLVPAGLAYATLVLTRRLKLPMRLPKSAGVKDWNYPDPEDRRPRQAAGTIYLGRDVAGRELWIASDDGRQHATIPGTTGAGKTRAILSFLCNALTHGSGFVLVDGKADNRLFGEVMALARRFGREDDVLHLNLLVASGTRESNSFNPFATGNADAIREMIVSQLGDVGANDNNSVFRSGAVALIGAMVPVLVWLRDNRGIPIDIEKIRDALELRVIWRLAVKRTYEIRDPLTGASNDVATEIPEDVVYPLTTYLGEIPGYDPALDYNKQKSDEPSKQHGYARFYFREAFTQLAVTLGHIFKVEQGDIDLRDVVLNRRILVVSLPALENSSDALAGLGRIVVASLRGMMAQMLSMSDEMLAPAAPFPIVLDELSYYATGDLDRMLAQGRSLNISFWLGFQEVSGIFARLGEKTYTLLGNANLTVAMRQQDANRTRQWIEDTSGKTDVAQATSYRGGDIGEYHDTRQADVREVTRVHWADLQRLIEGEAIILFGGRRIYAKVFHATVDTDGPKGLIRPLQLAPPDRRVLELARERIEEVESRIKSGVATRAGQEPILPPLGAVLDGFGAEREIGEAGAARAQAAIEAAGRVRVAAPQESDGALGRFAPMLKSALQGTAGASAPPPPFSGPFDPGVYETIITLETTLDASRQDVRDRTVAFLGRREAALKEIEKDRPSPREPAKLVEDLRLLTNAIAIGEEAAKPQPAVRQSVGMSP